MPFPKPSSPAPSSDERENLLGYIAWQRAQAAEVMHELTEEQVRWTPEGRLLPILGVVHHLSKMEWRWVEGRYLARDFPPRVEEFQVPMDLSMAEVVAAYWEQACRTEEIVRAAPTLEAPCLGEEHGGGPAHVLLGFERPVDLRWVLLHLLEETAHHVGHAESTRELLDGTRMRA